MGLTSTDRQSRVRRQTYRRRYQGYDRYRRRQPYSPYRRQGFSFPSLMSNMPPVFRPDRAGRRQVCRSCDQRSTVCTVYSVGGYLIPCTLYLITLPTLAGTFAGCTGVSLVAGPPGQLACNVATAPGSIGCGMNTLHCYMSGCGLINLPKLP